MRSKRSKKYRRIMQHYGITFGFREPYQVLVDSHHLRAVHAFKMQLQRYLENTLHGTAKPFITRCTLASILQTTDLHSRQRPDFLPPPKNIPLRHCSHAGVAEDDVLPEDECLLDLLRGGATGKKQAKNKEHFVLATADPGPTKNSELPAKPYRKGKPREVAEPTFSDEGIRVYAREIPGVPIIYVKRSVMILEEFSGVSVGVRTREEKEKFTKGINWRAGQRRKVGDEGDSPGEEDDFIPPKTKQREKKAKKMRGPNPLSTLKKKKKQPKEEKDAKDAKDAQQTASKKRAAPEDSAANDDSAEAGQTVKVRKKRKMSGMPSDGPEAV